MGPFIQINPSATDWTYAPGSPLRSSGNSPVLTFHQALPEYAQTPLHSLDNVARELGLGHVLVKDESIRFGLPAFKILGASWAVFRAVAGRLGLEATLDGPDRHSDSEQTLEQWLEEASSAPSISTSNLRIVTCTAGNWGRAVARMTSRLRKIVPRGATVFVPKSLDEATRRLIEGEGADVVVVQGEYDDCLAAAREEGKRDGSLLVFDVGFEGYEDVPQWVVEGYGTMLAEADDQVLATTGGKSATHAVIPVGAGSIAQAVTQHFKTLSRKQKYGQATVIGVEPTSAPALLKSLEAGKIVTVSTKDSIMCGMNCGTISSTAWPILRGGIDADLLVTDSEAHNAVAELHELGVAAGPCGAAALAALKRAVATKREELGLTRDAIVLLLCTEGPREYEKPANEAFSA